MGVWDSPQPKNADVQPTGHYAEYGFNDGRGQPTPTVDPSRHVLGQEGGRPLLDAQGRRGVYNGVPLGQKRQEEERVLETRYALMPSWLAALRGATRKALGR